MFDLNAAHSNAYDEVWSALHSNDLIPALFAPGDLVGAQEDLAQWLMEEQVCTPLELVRAVQAGSLRAWYHDFAGIWADRRARQLKRLHALGEQDMADAVGGWA